ncbi:hypothetical protein JAAARDRAFT_245000 [Jaapia argillacea MUCL 33604]|uniref:Uncharacterized protein n=1 Tax=Jaapia argillacea MUCL 33604 TaxID=933084 RepID=A0A067QFQ6_9AGAM|nr:hypothetical protein JAAARDRAFT_245000 [Jaapia argillacea MUCL 33604]
MSFANINDPAGIKALLEQLSQSQAWQTSHAAPSEVAPPPSHTQSQASASVHEPPLASPEVSDAPPTSRPSVASLLSQLQASPSFTSAVTVTRETHREVENNYIARPPSVPQTSLPGVPISSSTDQPLPSSTPKLDVRWLSFQQALPQLAQLSEDPGFVATIGKLKDEQADLERRLWEERRAIQKKHEDKVKVARTKAQIVGGLSRHEADMMAEAFRKELRKFDSERVLTAWDGLVAKQQAALEGLGVPAMYITDAHTDREVSLDPISFAARSRP